MGSLCAAHGSATSPGEAVLVGLQSSKTKTKYGAPPARGCLGNKNLKRRRRYPMVLAMFSDA